MSKLNSGNNLMTDAGLLGPISIWFELDYWSSLLSSVGDFTLSAFGFLIFIYTFTRHFSKLKESKITLYWLGAVFFYFLFVREGNREHDYYQMPFAAPVLFITAIGINQLFIQIKNGFKPKSCQFFTVLFWSLLIIVSGKYSYTKARLDMSPVVLGKKMKELNTKEVCEILNEIMEYELGGVVRYTHSSLMITGPYRIPIVAFLKEQAAESLLHAQQAGELLVGLDGHPTQSIAKIEETHRHSIKDILEESLEHELHALSLYKKLLEKVENRSVYLEEYTRGKIGEEEQHSLELKAMLKDFG